MKKLAIGELFRTISDYETGAFPTPGYYHYSASCNHCAVPACLASCPEEAISKDPENGIVTIDAKLCTGCNLCVEACPYHIPQVIASKSIVAKCDFCKDLLAKGENPVCVDSCPQLALEWGDIDALKAKHSGATSDLPILPDSTMTYPSTIIDPRPSALDKNFREKHI